MGITKKIVFHIRGHVRNQEKHKTMSQPTPCRPGRCGAKCHPEGENYSLVFLGCHIPIFLGSIC